jgi:P27 family predicted phage terminase small subunit
MARTGRPRKPIEQKIAEGTLNATRDPKTPILIGGRDLPQPSEYLSEGQRECFDKLVVTLKDANILDSADAGMLELAAIEMANVIACNQYVFDNGIIMMGAMGGPINNPAVVSRAKSLNHLRQLYNELGIGPAARARMQNMGVGAGKKPAQVLPGVGAKPTPLRVVNSG